MTQENATAGSPVYDLIRQREQLTQWIAKLDEVGGRASNRVTERVRADYADRLARVNDELASHRGEIDADLAGNREALAAAEQDRAQAADALDELSLRHLIGELDEAAWNAQRPPLEQAVATADETVAHARGEVERLQALAASIAGAGQAPAPADTAPATVNAAPPVAPPAEVPAAEAEPEFAEADFAEPEPEPVAAAPEPASEAEAEADEWEPAFGDMDDAVSAESLAPAPEAPPADATVEAPPAADAIAAADAAGSDEWDPFGGEFGTAAPLGDAEEDLPWLEGIDEAAKEWTPPATESDDSGLDFLREIEETSRPAQSAADLGADDLAFLEELDRAIGGPAPSARTSTPPPSTPAPPAAAGAGSRAEPLLCKECGAINEPHSWYCEICGSEL